MTFPHLQQVAPVLQSFFSKADVTSSFLSLCVGTYLDPCTVLSDAETDVPSYLCCSVTYMFSLPSTPSESSSLEGQ